MKKELFKKLYYIRRVYLNSLHFPVFDIMNVIQPRELSQRYSQEPVLRQYSLGSVIATSGI